MADNNKQAAISFLKLVVAGNVRQAQETHLADGFKHHNPFFEGSAEPLLKGMQENAAQNPGKVLDVKHAIAEGDFVAIHSYVRHNPEEPGFVVVHIFRFEQGRIVELWDLAQQIPEKSPNQYGMV
jgi:predicted SnoaL-like aldol condensation-catalyzing enzyme